MRQLNPTPPEGFRQEPHELPQPAADETNLLRPSVLALMTGARSFPLREFLTGRRRRLIFHNKHAAVPVGEIRRLTAWMKGGQP